MIVLLQYGYWVRIWDGSFLGFGGGLKNLKAAENINENFGLVISDTYSIIEKGCFIRQFFNPHNLGSVYIMA